MEVHLLQLAVNVIGVKTEINRYKKAETESKREWERHKDRKRAVRLNKQPNFVVADKI